MQAEIFLVMVYTDMYGVWDYSNCQILKNPNKVIVIKLKGIFHALFHSLSFIHSAFIKKIDSLWYTGG